MKSLDKKKTKDWEKELINSGKHLADILEQYNGNRQCKLCGAEPEKQSEWVIFLVKKLLNQQKQQILNLECLKEESERFGDEFSYIRGQSVGRNQLRNEIKNEIKKL